MFHIIETLAFKSKYNCSCSNYNCTAIIEAVIILMSAIMIWIVMYIKNNIRLSLLVLISWRHGKGNITFKKNLFFENLCVTLRNMNSQYSEILICIKMIIECQNTMHYFLYAAYLKAGYRLEFVIVRNYFLHIKLPIWMAKVWNLQEGCALNGRRIWLHFSIPSYLFRFINNNQQF